MFIRVIPFSRSFDTYGIIYSVPKDFHGDNLVWKIVLIPLKDSQDMALCVEYISLKDTSCKLENIRDIVSKVSDFIFLSEKQIQILDFLSQYYITPIHNALSLYFPKNLREKISKNTFEKIKTVDYKYNMIRISLTPVQEKIYEKIQRSQNNKHLIFGVTGSWKTQIYMKIIQENLKLWKQTLLLIPEIILTSQIGERVKKVFWEDVLLLHSGVSAAKKANYWMDIYYWNAKVVIGTRSSLFFPYNNLWSVIIDEEHDQSYISDNAPRYHSIDIAEKLSNLYGIPLILWSGTPKATTFYKALTWDYELLQILEKYSE